MGIISRIIFAVGIAICLYIIVTIFLPGSFNVGFFTEFGFLLAVLAMFMEITFLKQ